MPITIPSNPQIEAWANGKADIIIAIVSKKHQGTSIKPGHSETFDRHGRVYHYDETWGAAENIAIEKALAKKGYPAKVTYVSDRDPYIKVTFSTEHNFSLDPATMAIAESAVDAIWKWLIRTKPGLDIKSGEVVSLDKHTGVINISKLMETPGIIEAMKSVFISKYSADWSEVKFHSRMGGGYDLWLVG